VSPLSVVGAIVAVIGALAVAWSLAGRRGLPAASPQRFSGAMGGGLFVAVGVYLLLLGR
jgi:hypothetical protein